jgi:hypothetical protein
MLEILRESMLDIVNPAVAGGSTAVATFFGILLCLAIGRRVAKWTIAREGGGRAPTVGSLEAAVFALLGLMIAFTFSGALNRFDSRRVQAIEEANAIGTAWLRIDMLPAAAQPPVRDLVRKYVDARIDTYRKLPDIAAAQAEAVRAQKLQNEIWTQALNAARVGEDRLAIEMLLIPALNQMFDLSATRIAATQIHPPIIIYAMLIGLALASALLAGYQSAELVDPIHRFGFATIIALTIYVIVEIEYPRLGIVRIDAIDQLLVNVRASMN